MKVRGDQQPENVPDLPELQTSALNDGSVDLMADAKDGAAKQEYAPRVISGELAFLIRSALNTAIYGEQGLSWKGTSWRIAQSIKRSDIGGKTGTTNSAKVAWYAGFGANLVTTTYVGFDDNKRVLGKGEAGAKTAMPAWVAYMKAALSDVPERQLTLPPNIMEKPLIVTLVYFLKVVVAKNTLSSVLSLNVLTLRKCKSVVIMFHQSYNNA